MEKIKGKIPVITGFYLLGLFFFAIVVTTVLFVLKVPIGFYNIASACVLSGIGCYFLSGKSVRTTAISTVSGLVIAAICVIINFYAYDWSWDGNTYHKSMLALMEHGWNPFYTTFYDYADAHFPEFLSEITATWYDAYPKATEIWGACIYNVTGYIDTGKSYNLLVTVAAVLISYTFLCEIRELKKWQAGLASFLFILNPVSFSQMFTYYNDGLLWQLVFLCTLACLYLTFFENKKYTVYSYVAIFLTINIGFNVKFSSVIFFALVCGFLFIYWCAVKIREGFTKEGKSVILKHFLVLAASVISGICVTGATSYVINTIRYHNPVYTMIGEGSTDIMVYNAPKYLMDMSKLEAFISSLFARSNTGKYMTEVEWKLPFTFDSDEYICAQIYDIRTGGWGIIFGGIFILSLIVLAFAFVHFLKKKSQICAVSGIFAAITAICILFVPSMWWARYCVGLFFLPVAAMIYLFVKANKSGKYASEYTFAAAAFAMLLLFNMSPNVSKTVDIFKEYKTNKYQLNKLIALSEKSDISVSCGDQYKFYGRIFTLYDNGITDFTYDPSVKHNYTGRIYENYPVYYKVDSGIQTTDSLEAFLDSVKDEKDYAIVVSAKDEATQALTSSAVEAFRELGLDFDMEGRYRSAYLAVVDGGEVTYEKIADTEITYTTELDGKTLSLKSGGYNSGNVSSVVLDGYDYSLNGRGINIVIYDKAYDVVIDSICVDTFETNVLTR